VEGIIGGGPVRIDWPAPMAPEIPWYVHEVLAIVVSLALSDHP
jgi:hypothetical protein